MNIIKFLKIAEYPNFYIIYITSSLTTKCREGTMNARDWVEKGKAAQKKRQHEEAIRCFEESLKLSLPEAGPRHPLVMSTWGLLAEICKLEGFFGKAVEYHLKILDSQIQNYGEDHESVSTTWHDLGLLWQNLGDYDQALHYYENVLRSSLKNLGKEHPQVGFICTRIGLVWQKQGDSRQALDYMNQALDVFHSICCKDHPLLAETWNHIGSILHTQGEWDRAVQYYERAMKIYKKEGSHILVAAIEKKMDGLFHQMQNAVEARATA